ncbi:hypothetical protein [Psychrobacillus psychrodurans]|uniref:hypothetical protein n=1 Tax=Psychrobacillus psychrodurans TaxID=126157 RepID=UPI003CFFFB3A
MKKWLFAIGLIILFLGAIVFYNKLYYPTLPMESINKKEVIKKLNDSNEQIVKLSDENGYEWYIISERNTNVADEITKKMVIQHGWIFKRKDGSGLFFDKQGKILIVTTQKWTTDYTLVKIPSHFNY